MESIRHLLDTHQQLRASALTRRVLVKLFRALDTDVRQLAAAVEGDASQILARNLAFVAVLVEQQVCGGGLSLGGDDDDLPLMSNNDVAQHKRRGDARVRWRDFELVAAVLDSLDWVLAAPLFSDALDSDVMSTLNGPQASVAGSSSSPALAPRRRRASSFGSRAGAGGAAPDDASQLSLAHTQLNLTLLAIEHAYTHYNVAEVVRKRTDLQKLRELHGVCDYVD